MRFPLCRRTAVAGLLAAVLLSGCTSEHAAAPTAPPVPVVVAKAERKNVPLDLRAIGNVEAFSSVSLKSQVTGPVVSVLFREGQDVRKGDPLFEIDRRPFEVALQQAQADLARDQAKAANARVDADRYLKLFEQNIAPRQQYDAQRANADALDAAVLSDKAQIESAKLNLQYCLIRSPISGRTGTILVKTGNLAKANDVPILVTINQISPIYVTFGIPEQNLAELKRYNQKHSLRVKALVPDEVGEPEEGSLSFVDNSVDAATGMIRLKATFPNAKRRLWPGQFVTVVLTLATQPNAIVVPSQAVNTGQGGSFVYVVKDDNTAELRPITAGRTVGSETIVNNGLQPGETVVTDGQLRITSNSKVIIKPAS